jgi:DNA polymerase-1
VSRKGSEGCFRRTVVLDFEYEIEGGGLPRVLCMVADVLDENLQHVRTIRLWRGDFGKSPPFDIGPDTLVVGYSLWAEMTCFLQLGWQFPVHLFDQHTAYLATSNILLPYDPDETRKKPLKSLPAACRAYGIDGWEDIDKGTISTDIGEGRWRLHGRAVVLAYCEEDVHMSVQLLRRQLTGYQRREPANVSRVLHWSNYSAKTVSRIQARGMPIDMTLWNAVQENKPAIVSALLRKFDPSYGDEEPIYTADGRWSDSRFECWLAKVGVHEWPWLNSGKIQIDGDAFKLMYGAHPAIEGLHALRDSLGVIVRAKLPIGSDGRNRPSLFPFGTATGRNAQARSLFNAHAGMRSFMLFAEDATAVYLDWRTQEVGVAAARSGDTALMESYLSGDIYHRLALMCGITTDTDAKRWKKDNPEQRQMMKALQLGMSYGMGVRSLAKGLQRHRMIASEVIIRHKRQYPRYWEWREDMVQRAMLARKIESELDGWPLHLSTSPNKRTLFNFPMQSGGAEMLRLAADRLCDAGLIPSMLVHDGILLELQNSEQVEHAAEIMRVAGTEACGGLEIGADIDFDQRVSGRRFRDKRNVAQAMWATVMGVLLDLGVVRNTEGL